MLNQRKYGRTYIEEKNKERKFQFLIRIAFAAALGGFLFGYDTAVINGAVGAIREVFNVGSASLGIAVSSALLGSAGGALTAGWMSDWLGRRKSMWIAAILFLISSLGSGFATDIVSFIVYRIVGGVAVGFASVLAPAYIAEISPADKRGRLGSLQQLAIVVGIFLALLFDYIIVLFAKGHVATGPVLGLAAWRWMFLSESVPAILYGYLVMGIPRSPRHLIKKGMISEARQVIESTLNEPADRVIRRIQDSMLGEHNGSIRDLFSKSGNLLPIVWIGIALAVFQQFVGINVIFYYSSVLWEAVGFSSTNSLIVTVITSVTNVVTTFVAIGLIDKLGRKPLLLAGSLFMALTLGTMSVVFNGAPIVDGAPHLGSIASLVALLSANLFVFSFGFSWGPVVWVMLGEMFNNRIRAVALGTCAMVNWLANFFISVTFPGLLDGAGAGAAYGLYATAAAMSFFFVLLCVKETNNKELEDMS